MRKQLELILTACLPIMVLAVGFFATTSKAGLSSRETADPTAAGPYYRNADENDEGYYFGSEIRSNTLCPGNSDYNVGFDIYQAWENADVWAADKPNAVHWHRFQRWDFTSVSAFWGTNAAEITYDGELGWDTDDIGDGIGFPWNGYESHSRRIIDGEEVIYSDADVTTWGKYTDANEKRHICPKFHKYTPANKYYKYFCRTGQIVDPIIRIKESDGDFGPYEFADAEQQVVRRWVAKNRRWYYCIKIVEPE